MKIEYGIRKWNHKYETALHIAAENNSKEIGELLLIKGADIDAKNIIYQTLLLLFVNKRI